MIYGTPAESIGKLKIYHITKVAKYYLYRRYMLDAFLRFDVIEFLLSNGKWKLKHLKDVF